VQTPDEWFAMTALRLVTRTIEIAWIVERRTRLGCHHRPGGCRATNPAGPVPTLLQRGPVGGGLGGLPSPAAVSKYMPATSLYACAAFA
jgi:hypothetical protein